MANGNQTPGRGGRVASPRVLIAAAVVAALVIAGIVLVLRSGSSDTTATTTEVTATETTATETSSSTVPAAEALPQAADVEKLFAGIQQRGNQIGDPDAPAAMIEYVDIQCPYCAQFDTQALPPLIREYVRTGKLFLEIRPIASLGEDSQRGRRAMVAAGLQGKFFQLAHLLYLNQGAENIGWITDELLGSAVASISGLDAARFYEDFESPSVARQSEQFDTQARQAAIAVTPTIFVGKNGEGLRQVTLASASDDATVARAIEEAIK